MDDLTPENDSLVSAIVESLDKRDAKLREDSGSQWNATKRLIAGKDVIQAVVFFGALLYGAFVMFGELQAKPSAEQMNKAIESRVQPLDEAVTEQSTQIQRVEKKVDALEDSTQEILDEVKFQGTQLDCLGDKKCKDMPSRQIPNIKIGGKAP